MTTENVDELAELDDPEELEDLDEEPESMEDFDEEIEDLDEDLSDEIEEDELDEDIEEDLDEDDELGEEEDEETVEALEELETEELQLLDEESGEALLVDEVKELRAIRREELTLDVDAHVRRSDEFVCQSCFMVKRTSQLANKRKMFCADCV